MIDTLLAILLVLQSLATPGTAVYYAPSWDWQRIAEIQGVRIPPGHTPIAYPDCSRLGDTGFLWLGEARWPLRVVVADCGALEDIEELHRRGIVAEVPYGTAEEHGFVRRGKVKARLWLEPEASRKGTGYDAQAKRRPPSRGGLGADALPL